MIKPQFLRFNNSGIFISQSDEMGADDKEYASFFWKIGMANFKIFFE